MISLFRSYFVLIFSDCPGLFFELNLFSASRISVEPFDFCGGGEGLTEKISALLVTGK